MNKKFAFTLLLFAIVATIITLFILMSKPEGKINNDPFNPEPTSYRIDQKEGEENYHAREEFIAMMHRAAPGTNWRAMDVVLLQQKMQERAERLSGYRGEDDWDTLANGYAVGKWNEIGSYNTTGRVWATDIDFTTNSVYAFSDGGNLWKGDLDGTNWAVLNDNFKIAGSKFLKKIDERLIVATDQWGVQGIFYSDDEGITWTETTGMENVEYWGYVFDCVILNDSLKTMYALAYNWDYVNWNAMISLYRSTDLGASFTEIFTWDEPTYGGSGKFNIWCNALGDTTVFMIENENFYSLDSLGSPQYISTIPFSSSGDAILCGYENGSDKRFYVAVYNWSEDVSKIYRSADAGISWEETGNVESYFFSNTSFNCSKTIADRLFIGGINTYISLDGGDDWELINNWYDYYDDIENYLHADIPFIESFIDPLTGDEILLISTDGGLYKSYDLGEQVQNITLEGMRNAQYYDTYSYRELPEIIFAGSQDQGYQRAETVIDGKYYFDQLISGDYGHFATKDGGENLWMVYPGFITYIKNAATTSGMTFGDFVTSDHLWITPIMEDPDDNEVCWWAGGSKMYKVEKSGFSLNYEEQSYNFSNGTGAYLSAIEYSPINNNYWYALNTSGVFYYSTDRGETWTKTTSFDGPDSHWFYGSSIVPSQTELGTVYIAGSGYDNSPVYKTENNGESFLPMSAGLPSTFVYEMAIMPDDSLMFAATEVGPYVYVQDENFWFDIAAEDAPYQLYWSVDYVETIHAARFGTYGRGIFEFQLNYPEPPPPPLTINQSNTSKNVFIYPNPAKDYLNLKFDDFIPSSVVSVFDANGKVCLEKQKITFNKHIPFKLDIRGLKTGNYFIRVEAGNKTFLNKFIVSQD
ncbi:MAG: T9SS type A sorting domain-containing protein [Chitinophagales bacterium]